MSRFVSIEGTFLFTQKTEQTLGHNSIVLESPKHRNMNTCVYIIVQIYAFLTTSFNPNPKMRKTQFVSCIMINDVSVWYGIITINHQVTPL